MKMTLILCTAWQHIHCCTEYTIKNSLHFPQTPETAKNLEQAHSFESCQEQDGVLWEFQRSIENIFARSFTRRSSNRESWRMTQLHVHGTEFLERQLAMSTGTAAFYSCLQLEGLSLINGPHSMWAVIQFSLTVNPNLKSIMISPSGCTPE